LIVSHFKKKNQKSKIKLATRNGKIFPCKSCCNWS